MLQVVEEYMDDEQQGAYRYDEAYQAVAQQQMAAAAAVATASNGQTGQYGAPNVHHDGQVRASNTCHALHGQSPGTPLLMLQWLQAGSFMSFARGVHHPWHPEESVRLIVSTSFAHNMFSSRRADYETGLCVAAIAECCIVRSLSGICSAGSAVRAVSSGSREHGAAGLRGPERLQQHAHAAAQHAAGPGQRGGQRQQRPGAGSHAGRHPALHGDGAGKSHTPHRPPLLVLH